MGTRQTLCMQERRQIKQLKKCLFREREKFLRSIEYEFMQIVKVCTSRSVVGLFDFLDNSDI